MNLVFPAHAWVILDTEWPISYAACFPRTRGNHPYQSPGPGKYCASKSFQIQKRKEKNVIITVEQIEALRPYIENIENLISADDVDALLDAVDDAVVDNIVAHNDEPDEEGRRIQRIYDDIAAQNHVYWD